MQTLKLEIFTQNFKFHSLHLNKESSIIHFFLLILLYNFGDYLDILDMRPVNLGYFFPTIMIELSKFNFRRGNFSKLLVTFYGTYERGPVIIDTTMACDQSF